MLRACKKIAVVAFLMMGFSAITFGQAGSATVRGKVTDPSGLVVIGANVEATNTATSVTHPAPRQTMQGFTVYRASLPGGIHSR